nr:LysR substrate-binding domain-containing protein [uncultured Clostridium sp.]
MELRQLYYFLTVADTLHYGKAAETLHIAEQPLSFQIKKLENELGFKLFERTTRSVALTPAGEVFRSKISDGIALIEQGVEKAGSVSRGEAGKIRIVYNSMTLHNVLPKLVCRFRERHPDVEVVLTEHNSPELEQQILKDEADIGIAALYGNKFDGLKYETIFNDSAVIALPKGHPMDKKDRLTLHDLENESFLVYSRKTRVKSHDDLISVCHMYGFTPNIIQEAETDMALLGLVAAGLGVALVPGSFRDILTDVIDYRIIDDSIINVKVAAVCKDNENLPLVQEIIEIARTLS